jgi:hypothetical protein
MKAARRIALQKTYDVNTGVNIAVWLSPMTLKKQHLVSSFCDLFAPI